VVRVYREASREPLIEIPAQFPLAELRSQRVEDVRHRTPIHMARERSA
jgi:hypothetical protein